MKVYVLDASVAARFLIVEDLSDKAQVLLRSFLDEKVEMTAPDLIKIEIGNTLWKAVRQHIIDLGGALEKLTYFLKLKINSIELTERDYASALEWSVRNDATYYDSLYVKASQKVLATLLTADDTLYDKASKTVAAQHLRDL